MGKRDGLIPLMTYLPNKLGQKLDRRLKKLNKSKAQYLRGLIESDLEIEPLEMEQGRPRKEEEAT